MFLAFFGFLIQSVFAWKDVITKVNDLDYLVFRILNTAVDTLQCIALFFEIIAAIDVYCRVLNRTKYTWLILSLITFLFVFRISSFYARSFIVAFLDVSEIFSEAMITIFGVTAIITEAFVYSQMIKVVLSKERDLFDTFSTDRREFRVKSYTFLTYIISIDVIVLLGDVVNAQFIYPEEINLSYAVTALLNIWIAVHLHLVFKLLGRIVTVAFPEAMENTTTIRTTSSGIDSDFDKEVRSV